MNPTKFRACQVGNVQYVREGVCVCVCVLVFMVDKVLFVGIGRSFKRNAIDRLNDCSVVLYLAFL